MPQSFLVSPDENGAVLAVGGDLAVLDSSVEPLIDEDTSGILLKNSDYEEGCCITCGSTTACASVSACCGSACCHGGTVPKRETDRLQDESVNESEVNMAKNVFLDQDVAGSQESLGPHILRFFLDEVETGEGAFSLRDTSLEIVVVGRENSQVDIHAFSSNEKLIAFGSRHGIDVALRQEVENHLSWYADVSGAADEYENTGKVPDWYSRYEKNYRREKMGNQEVTAHAFLYEHTTGSTGVMMFGLMPVMGVWNNRVSSYIHLSLGGGIAIYDKSFYRKKLLEFWNFGMQRIPFTGPFSFVNDKMSSGKVW